MKLKKFLGAASAAAILSGASFSASAVSGSIIGAPYTGPFNSFSNLPIGTISTFDPLSDLVGSLFAASTISFTSPYPFTLNLDSVTFTSASVGTLTGDLDPSGAGFSFHNVVAGNYVVKASGYLTPAAPPAVHELALIGASYTVTAVPEPESYALFLAGLGIMGAIARRRSKANAV
jgi:hypothetical protein